MNHVALNLRLNRADTEETLKRLADDVLSEFPGPEFFGPEFSGPDFTE